MLTKILIVLALIIIFMAVPIYRQIKKWRHRNDGVVLDDHEKALIDDYYHEMRTIRKQIQ